MLAEGVVDDIHLEPDRNVHKLLLEFNAKLLSFGTMVKPEDVGHALRLLEESKEPSEKYIFALYVFRYQNPVVSFFVSNVLERIDVH